MKNVVQVWSLMMLLCINTSCSGQLNLDNEMDFEDEKFKVGEIWQYETRKGEEQSRVIILKVEKVKKEVIIHISVFKVKIKNPHKEGNVSNEIGHLPFSRESIDNSLIKLESSDNELPNFMDGYNEWQDDFEAGQGGIFTISVKAAVDYVEESLNQ